MFTYSFPVLKREISVLRLTNSCNCDSQYGRFTTVTADLVRCFIRKMTSVFISVWRCFFRYSTVAAVLISVIDLKRIDGSAQFPMLRQLDHFKTSLAMGNWKWETSFLNFSKKNKRRTIVHDQ